MFRTLRQRNFRLVWVSTMLTGAAQQMEMLVLGWFVLQLTDSPLMVGLVAAARLGANVLAAFSGAVADRMSRRILLLFVQALMASVALVMLALILTGLLQVWHIFAIAFLSGLARIFDQPARQALIADTVGADQIYSGVALNVAGMNVTQIAGPVLGGILFALFGPAGAYAFMALLYSSGLAMVFFVQDKPLPNPTEKESVWRSVINGLRYVRRNEILVAALIMAAIANLTAFPFNFTLMPVFARDVLGTDSAGLGLLLSAIGMGALIGSIGLASIPRMKSAGKLLIGAMLIWHAMMAVVFNSGSFQVSFAFLLIVGVAQSISMVLIAILLLEIAAPEFRGRVMGLRALAVYTLPFGSLVSGALAGAFGALTAATINAIVGIALVAMLAALVPRLRRPQRWDLIQDSSVT